MNTMHWIAASVILLSACLVPATKAKPVLEYQISASNLPTYVVPESAFHSQEAVEREAASLIDSWKTEPVSAGWTRLMLTRFVKHKITPTRAARGGALVHVAMHDAFHLAKESQLDAEVSVSAAAAYVLGYLFPAEEKVFSRIADAVAQQKFGDDNRTRATSSLAVGQAVGSRVVAYGEADGASRGWNGLRLEWYGEGRYYGPGTWEPTPPYYYYPPAEPFAPDWKPWVLNSPGAFRPTPPEFGSRRFMRDLQEVIAITLSLTEEQRAIAKFWVDGHGSVTPPGHWNQIALDLVKKHGNVSSEKTLQLFMVLNIALADAFIAAWDAKYHYWTVRPITAAKQLFGTDLKPAVLTPPFPSYVSGHATFSGAAGEVLAHYFPRDGKRVRAMAEEAAMSRLYGGIHYRHDNDDGLALGRRVAREVLARYSADN